MNNRYFLPGLLLGLTFLLTMPIQSAYSAGTQPDLKRLYEVSSSDRFQNPVIIIHGVFGAKIRNIKSKEEIWPGSTSKLLFSSYEQLALDIDPSSLQAHSKNTEAYALFDQVGGHDYYGKILNVLHKAGRYQPGVPGTPQAATKHSYYVFFYDWRMDIPSNAAKLNAFIDQIRRDYSMPKLKVDIVAHSMGALLTRYFIRYGKRNVLNSETFLPDNAGAAKVRKVVLIGAPNMGSVSGLQYFLSGYRLGFGAISTEVMATMPGSYNLLPHPSRNWMITPQGVKADIKLYDVRTWKRFKWAVFDPAARARIRNRFDNNQDAENYQRLLERFFTRQLEQAHRFHMAMSVPLQHSPVRYIVFGGDCELTPARCLIEKVRGKTIIRLHPENITHHIRGVNYRKLMLEPGDGRVTKPSLLARNSLDPSAPGSSQDAFPLAYSLFLCETHAELTGNISFQDNLLNILLLQETTADRVAQRIGEISH
ncbi:MAG: hypothetical protein Q9M08_08725 [Mariprofundus sp.]|nr:hypothetical protein [Mariprofundus sp.]